MHAAKALESCDQTGATAQLLMLMYSLLTKAERRQEVGRTAQWVWVGRARATVLSAQVVKGVRTNLRYEHTIPAYPTYVVNATRFTRLLG